MRLERLESFQSKMDVDGGSGGICRSPGQSCSLQGSTAHKELYKKTPNSWKDKFRRACKHRLRQNRHKLVEKLRETNDDDINNSQEEKSKEFIEDLIKKEFEDIEKIAEEPDVICSCCSKKYTDFSDDGIDSVFNVMDEIREELMKEEKMILQEYSELLNFDEKYICAAIECLDTDYVICPVCRRHQLLQNKQVFFCSCGVRIDTGYDGITLEYVRRQIEGNFQQHGLSCNDEAVFSVLQMEELDLHNLILRCQTCGFMAIVI